MKLRYGQRVARGAAIAVAALTLGGAITLAAATPSSAATQAHGTAPKPGTGLPAKTTLNGTSPSSGGAIHAASIGSNPYGCYGQTDSPHYSGHNPGYVNVISRTGCGVVMNYLTAATDLYRLRWYGWQYQAAGGASGNNFTQVQGPTNWYCQGVGTYTYQADTYHEVDDYAGHYYSGGTASSNRFGC